LNADFGYIERSPASTETPANTVNKIISIALPYRIMEDLLIPPQDRDVIVRRRSSTVTGFRQDSILDEPACAKGDLAPFCGDLDDH
jgi:hypothetical protein